MEQIIENGTVIRGWVGIGVQDLTEELADTLRLPKVAGALITEVVNASPADQAGIKPGDVLTAVEGKPVNDYQSTLNSIAALQPGKTATLKVVRDRREMDVKVSVGKRPQPKREER
jgi:serine protease DegQ